MKIINPAAASVHFSKGERIAYTTPGQGKLAILREIKAGYPEGEPRFAFFYEDRMPGPENGKFLHFSAAGAVRMALNAGRRVFVHELVPVCEIRESGAFDLGSVKTPVELEAPSPPALVPLGPNRTRDGREVRVICNDFQGTCPVIILAPPAVGHKGECITRRRADGTTTSQNGNGGDLVGHLPPEPVKPREVWVAANKVDGFLEVLPVVSGQTPSPEKCGYRLFREVLPDTRKQYHAWVRDADGDVIRGDANPQAMGYRKATLVELEP